MTKLTNLYALKYYTNAGDLKPPALFLFVLLFLSRTWVLFVLSLASTQTGNDILLLFYPDKVHFYLGLLLGLLPVIVLAVSGRRHTQNSWAMKGWPWCFYLVVFSVLGDIGLQLYYIYLAKFAYSATASIQLVFALWCLLYINKSKHLTDSFKVSVTS